MAIQLLGPPTVPTGPGRTWSVWDWSRLEYDYYLDPRGDADPGGWWARPGPAKTAPIHNLGDCIENLLREVPPTAKLIGRGAEARGEIGVRNRHAAVWGKTNVPGGAGMGAVGGTREMPDWLLPAVFVGGFALLFLGGWVKIRG